jgi:hypothetical protein
LIPRKKGANMGLSIYALKLGDKISREEYDNTRNGWYVYQAHGMEPINHIPTVEEGCYKADVLYSDCDIFYSKYSTFRDIISHVVLKHDVKYVWNNVNNFIGKPFIEFLQTSDCEGAIDYTVAEKILHDFEKYESVIKPELNEYLCRFFDHYVCVLKKTV